MNRHVRCVGLLALVFTVQGYGAPVRADDRTEAADDHHGPVRRDPCAVPARIWPPRSLRRTRPSPRRPASRPARSSSRAKPSARSCQLTGKTFERVIPSTGRLPIGFDMRLPLHWNGRFWYQANGGIDANVVTATGTTSGGGPLTSELLQGFAVISSDAGHNAAQNPTSGIDPQARLDFGYQAVGKLTPTAKRVIRVAYGKRPEESDIGGCSNGGRHTMVAAARYTDEYAVPRGCAGLQSAQSRGAISTAANNTGRSRCRGGAFRLGRSPACRTSRAL